MVLKFLRDVLETKIRQVFFNLGVCIGSCPLPFLIVPIVLFFGLSSGFYFFEETNDVRFQFTPLDSPSRVEYKVAQHFYKERGTPFYLKVAMMAKDGGSILRDAYIQEILKMNDYIDYEFNVTYNGEQYAYRNVCRQHCLDNAPISLFLEMYDKHKLLDPNYKFTYPASEIFSQRMYIADHLFGVEMDKNTKVVLSAKLVVLYFRTTLADKEITAIVNKWDMAMFRWVNEEFSNPLINMSSVSEGQISHEVRKTGMTATPYLFVSFIIIVIFTVSTSLRVDTTKSKPWEAFMGVMCPIMAIGAGFGLMLMSGMEYMPISTIAPFLVLAIGVDDAFIMLHAWHHTDCLLPVPKRMGLMLADAGPSITITSLTNALSFAIGTVSTTPAIINFCSYTSVCVMIDYVFQITFFAAVCALGGRREAKQMNAYCCCIKTAEDKKENKTSRECANWLHATADTVVTRWANALVSWPARITVGLSLVIYWSVAIIGCKRMIVDLTAAKLFLQGSPLHAIVHIQQQYMFREGGKLIILVNKPPDLRIRENQDMVTSMIRRFETVPDHSMGEDSTAFWLKMYMEFVGYANSHSTFFDDSDIEFTYDLMPQFVKGSTYSYWNRFLNMNEPYCRSNQPQCLDSFMITTGFSNVMSWRNRTALLGKWRAIAANYSGMNVTIFEDLSFYADQITNIRPTTIQTVVIALCCMVAVCFLFIPNLFSIICATLSLVSINVGVFGFLTWWGSDLDPISMITVVMSIGFSVDFTAHISYHYYKTDTACKKDRLRHALQAIGWPMIQAGTSTILSIIVLCIVQAYTIMVFVKTVFLVVFLGLIHGLVVLPVVLTALPYSKDNSCIWPWLSSSNSSQTSGYKSTDSSSNGHEPSPYLPRKGTEVIELSVTDVEDPVNDPRLPETIQNVRTVTWETGPGDSEPGRRQKVVISTVS